LLIVIPAIIKKTGLSIRVNFQLGFAFPLAFDYAARKGMHTLLAELREELALIAAPFGFEFYSIDESHACVKAFGRPNPEDTYLVADMGGGTMDLALFTGDEMQQIGSVQFAGEDYLRAFVRKKRPDEERQKQFKWELRDLIIEGKCHET